jgi:hypothetical protein
MKICNRTLWNSFGYSLEKRMSRARAATISLGSSALLAFFVFANEARLQSAPSPNENEERSSILSTQATKSCENAIRQLGDQAAHAFRS